MGPNASFCLVIFGVLGLYCELIWPGRVWQAVTGAAAIMTGGYFLSRFTPTASGLELLAAAAVLFLLDSYVETFGIAGVAGTVVVTLGFRKLLPTSHGIHLALAVPWCIFLGALTTALNWAARQARKNKHADL